MERRGEESGQSSLNGGPKKTSGDLKKSCCCYQKEFERLINERYRKKRYIKERKRTNK